MGKPRSETKVRLGPQLYQQMKALCFELDVTHQYALIEGLKLWIIAHSGTHKSSDSASVKKEATAAPELGYISSKQNTSAESAEWHEVLERILASGHGAAIRAVKHNLYAFHLLTEADKAGTSEGTTIPLPEHLSKSLIEFNRYARNLESRRKAPGKGDQEGSEGGAGEDKD